MNGQSTRDAILDTARRLFNEKGYGQVSMRQIAAEMNIAVGNVTYYFHRKQDLVSALMEESFRQTRLSTPVETLEQADELLGNMLDTLARNPFFFLDAEFAQDPAQREHHQYLRAQLFDGFERLVSRGYFIPAFDAQRRAQVLTMLLMTHLTWLRMTARGSREGQMERNAFLSAHWAVLEPYLTDKARETLRQMGR